MATRASWPILHPKPYRKGPTPDSVRRAADLGRPLDIDVRACRGERRPDGSYRDGVLVGLHWKYPGRDGYRWTQESVEHGIPQAKVGRLVGRPISALTPEVVWTLRSADGDRIWSLDHLVVLAGEEDAELEFEAKISLTLGQLRHLKATCVAAYGADHWREMTWVKKLVRIFGKPVIWRPTLRRARSLNFRTIALRVRTDYIGRRLPVTNYRK